MSNQDDRPKRSKRADKFRINYSLRFDPNTDEFVDRIDVDFQPSVTYEMDCGPDGFKLDRGLRDEPLQED